MKKILFTSAALLTGGVIGATAYNTVFKPARAEEAPAFREQRQEHRAEMDQVFANNDYEAWKAQVEERASEMQTRLENLRNNINEDSFAKLKQAHEKMQAGDYEGAKAIHQELGMGGFGKGMGNKDGKGMRMHWQQ
jgi:hypothetical protein